MALEDDIKTRIDELAAAAVLKYGGTGALMQEQIDTALLSLILEASRGGGANSQLPSTLGAKTGANSLSIVPASDHPLATSANQTAIRDRIAARNPATTPEVIITLWNAQAVSGTSPATDQFISTPYDWNGGTFSGINAIRLTGTTQNNATTPGAGRTFTLNLYWADVDISNPSTEVPVRCANRKMVLGTYALPNVTNSENPGGGVRHWKFADIILPEARYFWISLDRTAFNASATVNLTLYATRVM